MNNWGARENFRKNENIYEKVNEWLEVGKKAMDLCKAEVYNEKV